METKWIVKSESDTDRVHAEVECDERGLPILNDDNSFRETGDYKYESLVGRKNGPKLMRVQTIERPTPPPVIVHEPASRKVLAAAATVGAAVGVIVSEVARIIT